MIAMILSTAQAEAVYSAMCALGDVGARLDAFLEGGFHVREMPDGQVVVHAVLGSAFPASAHLRAQDEPEIYLSQFAFAVAYGLLEG